MREKYQSPLPYCLLSLHPLGRELHGLSASTESWSWVQGRKWNSSFPWALQSHMPAVITKHPPSKDVTPVVIFIPVFKDRETFWGGVCIDSSWFE